MAADSDKEPVGDTASDVPALSDSEKKNNQKKKKGLLSRMWNGIFRLHGDDLEKRLKYISKEEAAIVSRLARRSHKWRSTTRNLLIVSVLLEVVAVGYAIMTTRSLDLNWKMRALRVLPMFLLPCLSVLTYSIIGSFTRLRDRKDKKTLERLRAERQEKIDELKERTNYYTTQQLIQRYDPDPAAKAAAATVLASKLGADSGLKFNLGNESKLNSPTGKSSDVELVQPGALRNRKLLHTRSSSLDSTLSLPEVDTSHHTGMEGPESSQHHQMVVQHFQQTGSNTPDGSWLAKLAALLVGEDPSQSYALICGNCHMHNGLARKEDFPFITYYCPHCNALNQPKHLDDHVSDSNNQPKHLDDHTSASDNQPKHREHLSGLNIQPKHREHLSGLNIRPKHLDEHVSASDRPNKSSSNTGGSDCETDTIKNSSSPMVEKVSTSSPVAASADSTETDTMVEKLSTSSPVAASADSTETDTMVEKLSTSSPVAASADSTETDTMVEKLSTISPVAASADSTEIDKTLSETSGS